MLKTLMAELDGKPVCVVVPSDREISMKNLAAAFGGKTAKMMRPADAERLTGYHVGGISPFGQRKRVPAAIERAALSNLTVFVNGGHTCLENRTRPDRRRHRPRRRRARADGLSGQRCPTRDSAARSRDRSGLCAFSQM